MYESNHIAGKTCKKIGAGATASRIRRACSTINSWKKLLVSVTHLFKQFGNMILEVSQWNFPECCIQKELKLADSKTWVLFVASFVQIQSDSIACTSVVFSYFRKPHVSVLCWIFRNTKPATPKNPFYSNVFFSYKSLSFAFDWHIRWLWIIPQTNKSTWVTDGKKEQKSVPRLRLNRELTPN